MSPNVIPNADFSSGLSDWECTPAGVSLVAASGKRFVMLAGEKSPAAICSNPVDVIPNGAYRLWVEKAIRGDVDLAMIGREQILRPDMAQELIASESPVRIQATATAGKRVGIARVILEPVGARLRLELVRSTALFAAPGAPFQILCEVRNTGSEPVADAEVTLIPTHLEMLEEFRHPQPVPTLDVCESALMRWEVLQQRRAVGRFVISLAYGKTTVSTVGSTLKHRPKDAEKPVQENVAGSRRWFSVGPRPTRVVAQETDLGFGPMLVTAPLEKVSLGVLHQATQIVLATGESIPLFADLKRISARGVELEGAGEIGRWTISISPELQRRGVLIEVALTPKRRLDMASFEFGPFQTEAAMVLSNGIANVLPAKRQIAITWEPTPRGPIDVTGSGDAGLLYARTPPQSLLPGVLYRAAAVLCRPQTAIMRNA